MHRFEAMALLREVLDRGRLSAAGRSLRVPTLSRKISGRGWARAIEVIGSVRGGGGKPLPVRAEVEVVIGPAV